MELELENEEESHLNNNSDSAHSYPSNISNYYASNSDFLNYIVSLESQIQNLARENTNLNEQVENLKLCLKDEQEKKLNEKNSSTIAIIANRSKSLQFSISTVSLDQDNNVNSNSIINSSDSSVQLHLSRSDYFEILRSPSSNIHEEELSTITVPQSDSISGNNQNVFDEFLDNFLDNFQRSQQRDAGVKSDEIVLAPNNNNNLTVVLNPQNSLGTSIPLRSVDNNLDNLDDLNLNQSNITSNSSLGFNTENESGSETTLTTLTLTEDPLQIPPSTIFYKLNNGSSNSWPLIRYSLNSNSSIENIENENSTVNEPSSDSSSSSRASHPFYPFLKQVNNCMLKIREQITQENDTESNNLTDNVNHENRPLALIRRRRMLRPSTLYRRPININIEEVKSSILIDLAQASNFIVDQNQQILTADEGNNNIENIINPFPSPSPSAETGVTGVVRNEDTTEDIFLRISATSSSSSSSSSSDSSTASTRVQIDMVDSSYQNLLSDIPSSDDYDEDENSDDEENEEKIIKNDKTNLRPTPGHRYVFSLNALNKKIIEERATTTKVCPQKWEPSYAERLECILKKFIEKEDVVVVISSTNFKLEENENIEKEDEEDEDDDAKIINSKDVIVLHETDCETDFETSLHSIKDLGKNTSSYIVKKDKEKDSSKDYRNGFKLESILSWKSTQIKKLTSNSDQNECQSSKLKKCQSCPALILLENYKEKSSKNLEKNGIIFSQQPKNRNWFVRIFFCDCLSK